ncbi:MAG: hypothetical protein OXC19_11565, partial [Bryobacterales bacterium]|nr:hypothetical protein [Bryobacterales bacterium]
MHPFVHLTAVAEGQVPLAAQPSAPTKPAKLTACLPPQARPAWRHSAGAHGAADSGALAQDSTDPVTAVEPCVAASAGIALGRRIVAAARQASLPIALGAFLLAMVPAPSRAQMIPVPKAQTHQLASNLGQTSASTGNALKDYAYAQAFTTGSQQFLLNNIRVDFTAAGNAREQVYAYLYSATSSGRPGIGLAMLAIGG